MAPVTYELKDYYGVGIDGTFYRQELGKIVIPKNKAYRVEYVLDERGPVRRREYLLKYQGYREPVWSRHKPEALSATTATSISASTRKRTTRKR